MICQFCLRTDATILHNYTKYGKSLWLCNLCNDYSNTFHDKAQFLEEQEQRMARFHKFSMEAFKQKEKRGQWGDNL